MDASAALAAFITLFVVIDPIGLAPMFVALTSGMDRRHRRAVGLRACVVAFGILCVFALFGNALLGGLGISLPAFRIAGGLLLFFIALEMLFERRTQRREGQTNDEDHDPSVFPLATPLIAGPGAMATMILLATAPDATWLTVISVLGIMAVVVALVLLMFSLADPIERLLGRTGILVVTRLLGMLLAALSVQFVLDGLAALDVLTLPER